MTSPWQADLCIFEFILKDDLSELDGIELRIQPRDRVPTDKQENFTEGNRANGAST